MRNVPSRARSLFHHRPPSSSPSLHGLTTAAVGDSSCLQLCHSSRSIAGMGDESQAGREAAQQSKDDQRKLKNRRDTIVRKASELGTLCKAEVAVVITGPRDPETFVWPDASTARRLIEGCCRVADGEEAGKKKRMKQKVSARDLGSKAEIAYLDGLLEEIRRRKSRLVRDYGKDLRLGWG